VEAAASTAGVMGTLTNFVAALANTGRSPTAKKTSRRSVKTSFSTIACAARPAMA
jgi:hypothetical protein